MIDKILYVLQKLPGVTEEIARELINAGITDIRQARAAEPEKLSKAGLKKKDIDKIKIKPQQ